MTRTAMSRAVEVHSRLLCSRAHLRP